MTIQRDLAWQQLELTYKASIAHKLARYALAVDYVALPEDVVHHAKRCILDALGCAAVLETAEVRQNLLNAGVKPVGSSAQQLSIKVKAEIARMGKVIKDAGIRTD